MSFFSRFAVKQEPIYEESAEPVPLGNDDDDDDDGGGLSTTTVSQTTYHDEDDDVDDKPRKRARAATDREPRQPIHESSVQHVSLRPTNRGAPTIPVSTLMPHQERLLSLNDYDEPQQLVREASRRSGRNVTNTNESAHAAAQMINYLVARSEAGGWPVDPTASAGGGDRYYNSFLRRFFLAPPTRSMPCSQSKFVEPRFASTPISLDHFFELCATARPNEPKCCKGVDCKALTIENDNGQLINDTPFVAVWFKGEMLKQTDEFVADWKKRMCVCCECDLALRIYVNSHTTNSGVDPSDKIKTNSAGVVEKVKLAVSWHVLVEQSGQFCQRETVGPDALCFNGLVGNVPRPCKRGWRLLQTIETNRKKFVPPYTRYMPPADAPTRDTQRGF